MYYYNHSNKNPNNNTVLGFWGKTYATSGELEPLLCQCLVHVGTYTLRQAENVIDIGTQQIRHLPIGQSVYSVESIGTSRISISKAVSAVVCVSCVCVQCRSDSTKTYRAKISCKARIDNWAMRALVHML
jgi:hypothetical protein